MLLALYPGNRGRQIAMVLEEVQVPPSEFLKVMGLAGLPALRARVSGAPLCLYTDVKLMGGLFGVQMLIHNFPGFCQAKSEGENVIRGHHEQVLL
jgi:hypothetical protein